MNPSIFKSLEETMEAYASKSGLERRGIVEPRADRDCRKVPQVPAINAPISESYNSQRHKGIKCFVMCFFFFFFFFF